MLYNSSSESLICSLMMYVDYCRSSELSMGLTEHVGVRRRDNHRDWNARLR